MQRSCVTLSGTTYLSRCHHHATTNGVKGVRGDSGASSDTPAKQERCEEIALERADQDDGLEGVVHAKVEPTVDNNSGYGWHEATVEARNAIRCKGLLVNVDEAVELASASRLCVFVVIGQSSTRIVERVDEEKRGGTSSLCVISCAKLILCKPYTTRRQIAHHPLGVSISLFLVREHRLVGIAEGEVESLGGKVSDDIGSVASPKGEYTFIFRSAGKALHDPSIFAVQASRLEHLILSSLS